MPVSDDPIGALVTDVRSAVAAAHKRLQFTALRIERGNVDLGRLVEELKDLDQQMQRVTDLIARIEAAAPPVGSPITVAEA